jgi:hypothetical protein
MNSELTFNEEQKFGKKFIVLLIILISSFAIGILVWGVIQQLVLGHPFGNHPMSDNGLIISNIFISIFILLMDWLLLNVKMETTINNEGIWYRFYPFLVKKRFINWNDIDKAYLRDYKPIIEYGGWGIRFGFSGRAYNIRGNHGLQLVFRDGKKLLLGTQKPEELESLLKNLGRLIV